MNFRNQKPFVEHSVEILVFIDWYLPGTNAGGPVRSVANLIGHLGGEFNFSIITRNNDYCSDVPYPGIFPDTWTTLNDHCRVYYLSRGRTTISVFRKLIRETPFDIAWVNGIYSWKFSILPLLLLKPTGKKIIVSARGMLNLQAFTSKRLKKQLFIRVARRAGLYREVTLHATNEEEKQNILQQLGNQTRIIVAPNLQRKEILNYRGKAELTAEQRHEESANWKTASLRLLLSGENTKVPGSLRLVSVARISPEKGTLHALRFLSEITSGKVRFDLYGPIYNDGYWQECRQAIHELPANITVIWHGPIEGEKVPEVLSQAHFLLMPTEGENFGHSILEALSAGCPVIISDRTPWRNLKARKAGFDLPLEDSAVFVAAIEQAVEMDNDTFQVWSGEAVRLAMEYTANSSNMEACRILFNKK